MTDVRYEAYDLILSIHDWIAESDLERDEEERLLAIADTFADMVGQQRADDYEEMVESRIEMNKGDEDDK